MTTSSRSPGASEEKQSDNLSEMTFGGFFLEGVMRRVDVVTFFWFREPTFYPFTSSQIPWDLLEDSSSEAVKKKGQGKKNIGFESHPYHLWAEWPWVNHLTTLRLCFPTWKCCFLLLVVRRNKGGIICEVLQTVPAKTGCSANIGWYLIIVRS